MQFIGSVGTGSPTHTSFPFALFQPYLSCSLLLSFLMYSNLQRTKKRKKKMLVTAKRQMGWHVGRELLLCLAHKQGCLPCVLLPGV